MQPAFKPILPPSSPQPPDPSGATFARVLTVALQPNVLQLLFLLLLAGWYQHPLVVLSIVLGSFVLPLAGYLVYLRFQILPIGFDLDRRYRTVPFLINNACLATLAVVLQYGFLRDPFPDGRLVLALLGVAYLLIVNMVAGFITLFYKISLHLTAASALSLLLYLPLGLPLWFRLSVFAVLLLSLAWARLRLGAHDGLQIVAGIALGFSLPLLIFSLGLRLPA